MSDQAPVADGRRNDRTRPGWFVSGIIAFAALMMMFLGSLHALSGFMALFEEDRYVVSSSGLIVNVDYSVYGVVHLVLGITMVLAGWGLFFRRTWARVVTVIVALVSAVCRSSRRIPATRPRRPNRHRTRTPEPKRTRSSTATPSHAPSTACDPRTG